MIFMKRTYQNRPTWTITNLSGNLSELKSLTGSYGNLSAILDSLDTNQNYQVVKIVSCKIRIHTYSTNPHVMSYYHVRTDYDSTLTDPTEYNQYDITGHINSALDRDFISKQLGEDVISEVKANDGTNSIHCTTRTLDITNVARAVLGWIRSRIASDQLPDEYFIGVCHEQDNGTSVYGNISISIDYTVKHN